MKKIIIAFILIMIVLSGCNQIGDTTNPVTQNTDTEKITIPFECKSWFDGCNNCIAKMVN